MTRATEKIARGDRWTEPQAARPYILDCWIVVTLS